MLLNPTPDEGDSFRTRERRDRTVEPDIRKQRPQRRLGADATSIPEVVFHVE